jgi:hypothetical protein
VVIMVSRTVPIVAGCCHFPTRFPPILAQKCSRCIEICALLAPEVSKGSCLSCGPCLHNKNTSVPCDVVLSLLQLASEVSICMGSGVEVLEDVWWVGAV